MTANIRSKADELEQLLSQFKNEVTGLRDDNTTLGQQWEGDARTTFNQQFLLDAEKFDAFAQGIAQFIQQLRKNAEDLDYIERVNENIAANRKA